MHLILPDGFNKMKLNTMIERLLIRAYHRMAHPHKET